MARKNKYFMSVVVPCLFFLVIALITQNAQAQQKLVASAGGVGGGWYILLGGLAEIAKEKAGITIDVVPGGGVANPARVGTGDVDLGLAMPMLIAAAGAAKDPYKKAFPDIRVVAMGFSTNYLQFSMVEEQKVGSIDEIFKTDFPLKIVTGRSATSTAWIFGQILSFYGLSEKDIVKRGGKILHAPYGDWVAMVKDRHVDAMFDNITIPSPVLTEVLVSRKMKLFPIPEGIRNFLIKEKSLGPGVIPAGSYGIVKEDLPTCTVLSGIIANKKVPSDIVYKLAKVWSENLDRVRSIHKSVANWDPTNAWKNTGGILHPGAEKYYKEMGYMK
ncbi:MAG: TAXI family TRAP transporter solute-binding subunit [Deltaproteobacteria bacterium]|nr:TAXI family TRAP transporter solute-binding subunit [Deltaproteobacteria bacterium]